MYFNLLRYRKIYYLISLILLLASISAILVFGLKFGIEFTGGSILEIEYTQKRPPIEDIRAALSQIQLGDFYLQTAGEKGVILRAKNISNETREKILEILSEKGKINLEEKRFESIGPLIGKELREKTNFLTIGALLAILIYISLVFRGVQRPLSSFHYGVVAIAALLQEVLIIIGTLAFLGKYYGIEITIPVVIAILTVIGYGVNDIVIVFDRVRENLRKGGVDFEKVVTDSFNQTLGRSVSTSLTTLFVVLAILFFGGQTLFSFALTLAVGIITSTLISLFVAVPLLVTWNNRLRG